MFENKGTFYNFIRNVAECTKLYGYFIATCYDGRTIFNMLKRKQEGESREIYVDDKKVWSITKQYDATTFEDNESCLGYKIDVYQDSINQTLPEYLVNFEFLKKTMHMYGFELIDKNEARMMHLPNGSGMFNELFDAMEYEVRRNNDKSADYKDALRMANYEKDISFLNRYFVFKKIQTRNVEQLTKMLMNSSLGEEIIEEEATEKAKEAIEEPKTKKLNEEIILEEEEKGKDIEILADIVKSKKRKTAKKPSINVQQIEIKEGADNEEEEAEILINYDVKKKSKKTSTRKKKDNP
jgi:hypothetical protein